MTQAPFSPDQVKSLEAFQQSGVFHAYTCGGDHASRRLIPTEAGWVCEECEYVQYWAHEWSCDWSWQKAEAWLLPKLGEVLKPG